MIFIAGPHNSGKTTVAQYLKGFGFLHVETSEIVRRRHDELAPGTDFQEWTTEQGHKFDCFIAEQVLLAKSVILGSPNGLQDVVVTGNRQLSGILHVRENVPPLINTHHLIIYLDADERTLYERQNLRSDRPHCTFEEFTARYFGYDLSMGIEQIREAADLVIRTERPIGQVLSLVRVALAKEGYSLPSIEGNPNGPETGLPSLRERLI